MAAASSRFVACSLGAIELWLPSAVVILRASQQDVFGQSGNTNALFLNTVRELAPGLGEAPFDQSRRSWEPVSY